MAISTDGTHLYLTDPDGTVLTHHLGDIAAARSPLVIGDAARHVRFSADATVACTTNSSDGTASIIDTVKRTIIGTIKTGSNTPCSVAIAPDGERLYVAYEGDNRILAYDASDLAQRPAEIDLHATPHSMVVSRVGARLYTAGPASHSVEVIDTASAQKVGGIYIHGAPRHLSISPEGDFVYAINADNGTVTVIGTLI